MTDEKKKDQRILLVEDNEKILHGNKRLLEWEGYNVDAVSTLREARTMIGGKRPDVIVLDIMLPDGNGLDFISELRKSVRSSIPILLLTGLITQDDIVRGLKAGGDDYITKPYDFTEMLARIEALLRRAGWVPETLVRGRLTLDVAAGVAFLDGTDLLLTKKEFALLMIFVQNPDRFIGGEYLYEKVWKAPLMGDSQAIRKMICRLRDKLVNSGWCIRWSRGEGYCFEKE